MIFFCDIEGDTRNMSDLRHVREALIRLTDDLKQKIGRGDQAKRSHGPMMDSNGNEVGEWDFRPTESETESFSTSVVATPASSRCETRIVECLLKK